MTFTSWMTPATLSPRTCPQELTPVRTYTRTYTRSNLENVVITTSAAIYVNGNDAANQITFGDDPFASSGYAGQSAAGGAGDETYVSNRYLTICRLPTFQTFSVTEQASGGHDTLRTNW